VCSPRTATCLSASRRAPRRATRIALATEAVRAFERAYELESWDVARHGLKIDMARAAVAAGLLEVAGIAAHAALRDASQFERTWQYGNAEHWGHVVLGHLARLRGDVQAASRELGLAGRTRGSPQFYSFGPDLGELAQNLLDVGKQKSFSTTYPVQRFWENGSRGSSSDASHRGSARRPPEIPAAPEHVRMTGRVRPFRG
jgi:hypothetical protein